MISHKLSIFMCVLAVALLCSCGGNAGGGQIAASPAPTFSTTPVSAATEGTTYTYSLGATDPNGGTVTYSLTAAPTGATLNGNTITWTPTAAQSRVANNFTVTARTASGASATQSWSVTPNGTVRISSVYTYWDANGGQDYAGMLSPDFVAALVPKADGSFDTLTGTLVSDGHLDIPNVPAGYFWLRLAPQAWFWTNSSTFDFGTDLIGPPHTSAGTMATTVFNLSFTGFEPVDRAWVEVKGPDFPIRLSAPNSGSSTVSATNIVSTNIDIAQARTAYAIEYEPVDLGGVGAILAGPSAQLSDLNITAGATNNISGTLAATNRKSFTFSVKGSEWQPLFARVAPTTVHVNETPFELNASPYLKDRSTTWRGAINLFVSLPADSSSQVFYPIADMFGPGPQCSGTFVHSSSGSWSYPSHAAPITTDQNFGTVQFVDPFPQEWARTFTMCQRVAVPLPLADCPPLACIIPQVPTDYYMLSNGLSTGVPSGPVSPLISAVENPKIGGLDLFTQGTLNAIMPTLTWDKPALGNPSGYKVTLITDSELNGNHFYGEGTNFYTSKTSMTLPPPGLLPGKKYMFVISAIADGKANVETSPNRSALPRANAEVISAVFVVAGGQ